MTENKVEIYEGYSPKGFASRLNMAMRLKGITTTDLSKRTGIDRTTIWRYQKAKRGDASIKNLVSVSEAIGINLCTLVMGDNWQDFLNKATRDWEL